MTKKKQQSQVNVKALAIWQAETDALAIVNIVGKNTQGELTYYEPKYIPLLSGKKYSFMEVTLLPADKAKVKAEAAKVNKIK